MAKTKTTAHDKQSEMIASAVKAFWDGKYEKAKAAFEKIAAEFGEEMHLVERLDTYISVCERRIDGDEIKPRGSEEQRVAGLYHVNNGDLKEGISWLKKAAKKEEDRDVYFYELACAYALAEQADEALEALGQAIALNAENRFFALNNPDFEALHSSPGFKELVSK